MRWLEVCCCCGYEGWSGGVCKGVRCGGCDGEEERGKVGGSPSP